MSVRPNIVLVHGAWADGSCWSAVIESLQADGYNVTAPQFPESSLAAAALQDVMGVPAWKSLPTWYLVAAGDQAIPPDAERQFAGRMGATTVEVATNHVAMASHADDVVQLIETAAEAVAAAT